MAFSAIIQFCMQVVPINDTFKTLLIANPDNLFRVISLYLKAKLRKQTMSIFSQ